MRRARNATGGAPGPGRAVGVTTAGDAAEAGLRRRVGTGPGLRIAFIGGRGLGRPHGGIETFYEEVGSRLGRRGHEITVYCRPRFTPEGATYRGMRVQHLPTVGSKHFETLIHSFLSTLHGSARPYDLIHIHAIGSSVFSFLPRLLGRPTVVTVHSLDWQFPKWNAVARSCLRFAEWTSVAFPTRTVAVSETLAGYLREKYAVPVAVIPNGVDLQSPRAPDRILELGLVPGKYVLYVGRLSEEKGPHLLLDAFRRAGPEGFQLVFAGGARYAPEYERRLRSHETDAIRFLGWVDRETLAELYSSCALFVLPSRLEGLCMALLEAMAAAAPVLVSDIPQNREAVGDAGFVFRSGDRDDLARQLELALSDPERRSEAADRLRHRVRERYAWDVIVDRIERLYRSVIERDIGNAPAVADPTVHEPDEPWRPR